MMMADLSEPNLKTGDCKIEFSVMNAENTIFRIGNNGFINSIILPQIFIPDV